MWYLKDLSRYQAEVDRVQALAEAAPWLSGIHWHIADTQLVCDADLQVGEVSRAVSLIYNAAFPSTPPSVLPRVPERLSAHQYGLGELCLEYGPDNWIPELSGVDMLESAYRLLRAEVPTVDEAAVLPVPARHSLTLGQELRHSTWRFAYSSDLLAQQAKLTQTAAASFCCLYQGDQWIAFVRSIQHADGSWWTDTSIPEPSNFGAYVLTGFIGAPAAQGLTPDEPSDAAALRSQLVGVLPEGSEVPDSEVILTPDPEGLRGFLLTTKANSVLALKLLPLGQAGARQADEYTGLSEKRVGLIGCGSVGSKVAISLARAGVRNFLLIDDDIMLPANLVRNELDWNDIGQHKVNALKRHILRIQPEAQVIVARHRLGGQESGRSLGTAVTLMAHNDVIVDASAHGRAFNMAAAAALQGKRTLVWAEVFAGGIGGMIARSRPGLDPSPHLIRCLLAHWYVEQNVPAPGVPGNDYDLATDDQLLIADDAEVTIIAAHLTRFVTDALIGRSPSLFPASAYVIGLRPEWLFGAPFDVRPIDLGGPEPAPQKDVDIADQQRIAMGLSALIEASNAQPAH